MQTVLLKSVDRLLQEVQISTYLQKETPSDGVITGYGVIDGSLVYVYSQDATVLNGTVGEMHAKKIARLYDFAMKTGAPVISLIDCAGMRLQEATDALNGFGEIYMQQTKSKRCDSTDHRYLRNLWRRNGYDSGTDRLYSDGRKKSKIICQFSKRHRRKMKSPNVTLPQLHIRQKKQVW